MNYPVWRFHKEKCADGKIVFSAEEDKALGLGWVSSPALFDAPKVLEEPKPEVKAETPKPKHERHKKGNK